MKPTNPKDALGSRKMPFLFPPTAILHGNLAMLDGALKYGLSNYRAIGVRASIYFDAALRHLYAWMEGEDLAPDSGVHHLGHALACLAIILDAEACGKLMDDRRYPGGYHALLEKLTPLVTEMQRRYQEAEPPKHFTIEDVQCHNPEDSEC